MPVDAQSIRAAYQRIRSHIVQTPVTHSATFSQLCGCNVLFKLENLQMTGSFKERGAINKLLSLSKAEAGKGVIAASAGNHAQAVAYHASRLGISTRIVMPQFSPLVKIRSTEHWGARVILAGDTFDDAYAYSLELAAEEDLTYLHPFDDPLVREGQGTLAVELLEDPKLDRLDAILVPVGGGGLISGIAEYVKQVRPAVRIIGVEEESCRGMGAALDAGGIVELPAAPVLADGIAVRRVSEANYNTVQRLVDQVVSVTTDEIANAVMLMLEIEKTLVEGSAAVTIAALLNDKVSDVRGTSTLSVISGGNIDMNVLAKIINRGLTFDGRIARINSVINDRPGALELLLGAFRETGANVLEVHHHRFASEAPIGQIGVSVTVETRNTEHIQHLLTVLEERGYGVNLTSSTTSSP